MKLTVPIYRLKREAKLLSRQEGITHLAALDQLAQKEGFASWSLLAATYEKDAPAKKLYDEFSKHNLILLAARPGHGKTLMALELAIEAIKAGHKSFFFTLEYTEKDTIDRLIDLGVDLAKLKNQFEIDCSDRICAEYIAQKLDKAQPGTFIVIDYLQLLDQRRENPELKDQVVALHRFAKERKVQIVAISQIDRTFESKEQECPSLNDLRLPNPFDVSLFDKACFIHNGTVQLMDIE